MTETANKQTSVEQWGPLLIATPGKLPLHVVAHSHFTDPILGDGPHGRSRRYGDASRDVQALMCDHIADSFVGLDDRDLGFVLALVRVESGFNPDAAAGSTSASGLGQFIDATRQSICSRLHIANAGPFNVELQLMMLQEAMHEAFARAGQQFQRETDEFYTMAYAYHHDGPGLSSGVVVIARERVVPMIEVAVKCLEAG